MLIMALKRQCCNCLEEVAANLCCLWGSSGKQYSCHVCKTNYNRNLERCKENAQRRAWWKSMSKEERTEWFKRNRQTYEPCKRKAFDEVGEYQEKDVKACVESDNEVYQFLPLDEWIVREKLLGRVHGTEAEKAEQAKESFYAKVLDRSVKKRKVGDEWCIGVFRGVEERIGTEKRREQQYGRKKRITDTIDHDAAVELEKDGEKSCNRWLQERQTAKRANVELRSTDMQSIPDGLARTPVAVQVDDDYADEIKREVVLKMQRDAKVLSQEELDDHEASQAAKIAKRTVGRPAKPRSQLLAEISKIVRDRMQRIKDGVEDLRTSKEQVAAEAVKSLGTVPPDVATVQKSMDEEVASVIKEMEKLTVELSEQNIGDLLDEDSGAGCAERIRQMLVEKSAPAFKTHEAAGKKAIAAFRSAVRKASKVGKPSFNTSESVKRPPGDQVVDIGRRGPRGLVQSQTLRPDPCEVGRRDQPGPRCFFLTKVPWEIQTPSSET